MSNNKGKEQGKDNKEKEILNSLLNSLPNNGSNKKQIMKQIKKSQLFSEPMNLQSFNNNSNDNDNNSDDEESSSDSLKTMVNFIKPLIPSLLPSILKFIPLSISNDLIINIILKFISLLSDSFTNLKPFLVFVDDENNVNENNIDDEKKELIKNLKVYQFIFDFIKSLGTLDDDEKNNYKKLFRTDVNIIIKKNIEIMDLNVSKTFKLFIENDESNTLIINKMLNTLNILFTEILFKSLIDLNYKKLIDSLN